jgi:hypothetical protein
MIRRIRTVVTAAADIFRRECISGGVYMCLSLVMCIWWHSDDQTGTMLGEIGEKNLLLV